MALDAELLDRFERDWNDAMANYEARTTASRMGNVQYDPASRTFAPQEVDPSVSRGIQNELFGPLQSKWGLLAEGAGRRSAATQDPHAPEFFNTRAGVFMTDPFSGKSEKIIDVPPARTGVTSTPESRRDLAVFQSALRRLENARRAQTSAATNRETEAAAKEVAAAEAAFAALQQPAAKTPSFTVDPNEIPYGSPVTRVPPPPETMQMFMGDPAAPVIQDPPPAPLPVGPSTSRGVQVLQIRRK